MYELGNDHYMLRMSIMDLEEKDEWAEAEEFDNEKMEWVKIPINTKPLVDYLREKSIPEEEDVIIHWWW